MTTTTPDTDRADAREALAGHFPAGATVQTLTDREGELRRVRFFTVDGHGLIRDITAPVSVATGYRLDSRGRIIFSGGGVNAGFYITYRLSQDLHGDGYALRHHGV